MRSLLVLGFAVVLIGCGGSSGKTNDMTATPADQSVVADQSVAAADMAKIVTPYNMPGSVYCYDSTACTTPGSAPVCCDAEGDGGFSDTCVAAISSCTTGNASARAYQCGQASDCGVNGMLCCGATTTSGSGKMSFTSGTSCSATCPAGSTQLCVSDSDCTGGTTCVGKDVSGRDVGLCM